MDKAIFFSLASTVIYIIAILPYLRDVLSGRTLPHPYSQLVWTIVFFISTLILIINKEYIGSIPGIASTIANSVWCYYGFKSYGKLPINWFDKLCLILALITLAYGLITRDFFNTILLAICIDFLALLPTVKKGWLLPWRDTISTWFFSGIQYMFMIFALKNISFENMGFWVYNIGCTFFFFFMVFFRRWYLKGWKSIFE